MAVLKTTSPPPPASAPKGLPTKDLPSPSTRAANRFIALLDDDGPVDAVDLRPHHLDPLVVGGGDVLADVIGPDRQLPVAAVDQDRQLDGARPAVADQPVHRRPDGAAVPDD